MHTRITYRGDKGLRCLAPWASECLLYRVRLKQAFRSPSTAPLLERHPSLPPMLQRGKALIHGLVGELRPVAAKRSTSRRQIARAEGHLSREQGWSRRVDADAEPARAARHPLLREAGEVQPRRLGHRARLEQLGDDVAHETVVGVAIPTPRTLGDNGLRSQLTQHNLEPRRQTVQRLAGPGAERGEPGIREAEQDRRLEAELAGDAARLAHP